MKKAFLSLSVMAVLTIQTLSAQNFKTDYNEQRNTATFVTEAPLEDIVGTTRKIQADLMINQADLSKGPKGKVTVDLTTLNTGIKMRDDHMKSSDYLHTEKFPEATFTLTGITGANALKDGVKTQVNVNGNITIHGVTKNISAPASLTWFKQNEQTASRAAGNLLKVNSTFNIKMSDFGIKVPSMLMMKVGNDVKITLDFVATDAGSGSMGACNPCGPCSPKNNMKGNPCSPCSPKSKMKPNPCSPCSPK